MKKHALEFVHRGFVACWGGPVILAIIYAVLGSTGAVTALAPAEVAKEILSITVMAFIAAGITSVYQIERLPLFFAILLHGVALYLDYLIVYLVNGWLARGSAPFLIFTAVFIAGYAVIWACIYFFTRRQTQKINRKLGV